MVLVLVGLRGWFKRVLAVDLLSVFSSRLVWLGCVESKLCAFFLVLFPIRASRLLRGGVVAAVDA